MIKKLLERKDVEKKILLSLERTKFNKKEHGFNFYSTNGGIRITNVIEGDAHNVNIPTNISREKILGAFHTHTRLTNEGDIIPSPKDIVKSIEDKIRFFCVGGNREDIGIVRCFNKDDLHLEVCRILDETKKSMTKENMNRAAGHIVGHMIKDKIYLNSHSFSRVFSLRK